VHSHWCRGTARSRRNSQSALLLWKDGWWDGDCDDVRSTHAPIFRIFDEAKAREFYVDFLGFTIDWEHRFEPGLPLYMQVSKDDCILHLSEHHGDGTSA